MNPFPALSPVLAAAFAIGFAFGAIQRLSGYCAMGAVSDMVLLGDRRRMRAWVLGMAAAILATQALHLGGWLDLGRAGAVAGSWRWLGALAGGVLFGLGMVMAGGCGAMTLVRLGGGSLKALVVVLVAGPVAAVTARGLLAPARQWLDQATADPPAAWGGGETSLPGLLAALGLAAPWAHALPAGLVGLALLGWSLSDRDFRATPRLWLGGAALGLLAAAGWAATGILGDDPFDPVPLASLSFMLPMGDGLLYLMTFTGAAAGFGVVAAAGVVAGAFAAAWVGGRPRLEAFADRADFLSHLRGAALMGVGGVMAGGCTVGQGLSGLALLSLSAPLAVAGIVLGGVWALRGLEEGGLGAGLRAMLRR